MCGIIGSINLKQKYRHSMERTIRELLFADTLRGSDASGIYCVRKGGSVDWSKECVDGWTFPNVNKRAKQILRAAEDHTFIIGHNRAATMGGADDVKCAHPIVIEKEIGLVHNGTLSYWPGKHDAKAMVHDSTAIAHLIAEKGVQEFVDKCQGAYSLVWHDQQKNTLNFLRNHERPMAFVYTEDIMFFGSELGMISWVAQRNQFQLTKHFYTEPMALYTFEPGEADPKIVKLTKNSFASSGRQRFPQSRRSGWGTEHDDYYGHSVRDVDFTQRTPPIRGPASAPYGSGNAKDSTNDDSPFLPELVRSREEAERLARELEQRDKATEESRCEESQESGENGSEETQSRGRKISPLARIGGGGKPKVRSLSEYKGLAVGKAMMFSIEDYGDVNEEKGFFVVKGVPDHAGDYPRVMVMANIHVKDMTVEHVQKSKKYFWTDVISIHSTDTGAIIIWGKNVRESAVDDPAQQVIRKIGGLSSDDDEEPGETVVTTGPEAAEKLKEMFAAEEAKKEGSKRVSALEEREFCQGCHNLSSRSKLRLVHETTAGVANGLDIVRSFRLCEDCVVVYAENRDLVVPPQAKGTIPKHAKIMLYKP